MNKDFWKATGIRAIRTFLQVIPTEEGECIKSECFEHEA